MKLMKNSKPFNIILDPYNNECYKLYCVVRSLFSYPEIDEDEDLDGKLYASAFTFLCQDYLSKGIDYYIHDDFDLFVEEMNFGIDEEVLEELKNDSNTIKFIPEDFSELVWVVIKDYELKIKKDIHSIFHSTSLKMKLFASIYAMGENSYSPNLNMELIDFFERDFI